MSIRQPAATHDLAPPHRWEWAAVAGAVVCVLVLGFSKLGAPSLWHDELVHYYVAKGIQESGRSELPSGQIYPTYIAYNTLLAAWMTVIGDNDAAARGLTVTMGCVCIVVFYSFSRRFLGSTAALVACYGLALSPWFIAWARQARFYVFQQLLYLIFLMLIWNLLMRPRTRATLICGAAALGTYLLAILTSYHSILFLGSTGAYSALNGLGSKPFRRINWSVTMISAATGIVTLVAFKLLLGQVDTEAVFTHAGLGNQAADPERADLFYYFRWLYLNLSAGYFIAAMAGFVLVGYKEGKRGWYWALAFWVPILVLNFFIGYRRPRFMFFLFPIYVGAFSYSIVEGIRFLRHIRRSWLHMAVCVGLLAFGARLAVSTQRLIADSVAVAKGAELTLAKLHASWRDSCAHVSERLTEDDAVLASTFLPVYHYLGRVDNWYPSRFLPGEIQESGMSGLRTLDDLRAWLENHPRGYYIADRWQFDRMATWPRFADEYQWVVDRMDIVEEASTETVSVWRWTPETLGRP